MSTAGIGSNKRPLPPATSDFQVEGTLKKRKTTNPSKLENLLTTSDIRDHIFSFLELQKDWRLLRQKKSKMEALAVRDIHYLSCCSRTLHKYCVSATQAIVQNLIKPLINLPQTSRPEPTSIMVTKNIFDVWLARAEIPLDFRSPQRLDRVTQNILNEWGLKNIQSALKSMLDCANAPPSLEKQASLCFILRFIKFCAQDCMLVTKIFDLAFQFNQIEPLLPFIPNENIPYIASHALGFGNIKVLDWLYKNAKEPFRWGTTQFGAVEKLLVKGNIATIDWVYNHPDVFPHFRSSEYHIQGGVSFCNMAHIAVQSSRINVLNWINNQHDLKCLFLFINPFTGENVAHTAARGGRTNVLDWMKKQPDLAHLLKGVVSSSGWQGVSSSGWNIAHCAADSDKREVLEWIEKQPDLAHLLRNTDAKGINIAHHAARQNRLDILRYISSKPDLAHLLKKVTHDGSNIAHRAAKGAKIDVLNFILGNPTIAYLIEGVTKDGSNIAHFLAARNGWELLHTINSQANLAHLLKRVTHDGSNIAHHAAKEGFPFVLEGIKEQPDLAYLLKGVTNNGWNIAHCAANSDQRNLLEWIKEQPDLAYLLKGVTNNGWNIAHCAANSDKIWALDWIKEQPDLAGLFSLPPSRGQL